MKRTPVSSIQIKTILKQRKPEHWAGYAFFASLGILFTLIFLAVSLWITYLILSAFLILFILIVITDTRLQKRKIELLNIRGKADISKFVSNIEIRNFSPLVVRYIYEKIIKFGKIPYQIYPNDDFENILKFGNDDIIDILIGFERDFKIPQNIEFPKTEINTIYELLIYSNTVYENAESLRHDENSATKK